MKMKIDQTPPQRNRFSLRTMFFTLLVCVMTSVYSYGQSTSEAELQTMQDKIAGWQLILPTIDVSTPEGAAEKANVLSLIAEYTNKCNQAFSNMSLADQLAYLEGNEGNLGAIALTPEQTMRLLEAGQLSGSPFTNGLVTSASGSSSTGSSAPTSGPIITTP